MGDCALQHVGQRIGFGLAGQDRDDGGRIDEHYTFPLSSS